MKTQCIAHTGVNEVKVCQTQVRAPSAGEILVEAKFTCISPGTELRCLRGREGTVAKFPFVPGYAMVGHVRECGAGVVIPVGAAVLISGTSHAEGFQIQWGGHIHHAVTPAEKAIVIPAGIDLLDAVMTPLAAIAFHGVRLSRPVVNEAVAVIGLGVIGQCSARLHHLNGTRTVAADTARHRVDVALRAGVKAVRVEGTLAATFAPHFPSGADIVVDATGVPAVIPQAIEVAHDIPWDNSLTPSARYLVQGSYEEAFTVPYGPAFMKELPFLIPRASQRRDNEAVLSLLTDTRLQLKDLVTSVRPPEQAPETYAELREPGNKLLTVAFNWEGQQ